MVCTSPAKPALVLLLLLCSNSFALHWPRLWTRDNTISKRAVPEAGYYSALTNGGSMLTTVPITWPPGQGEPLNMIISANSDARVLVDQQDNGGLKNFFLFVTLLFRPAFLLAEPPLTHWNLCNSRKLPTCVSDRRFVDRSLSFSTECLGQHLGSHQGANLGDGNGLLNETEVMRYNYGDPYLGACKETVQGGNHFRYWIQNGKNANSGAIFMACSYELPVDLGHDIIRDGYNLARDYIVGNITGVNPPPSQTWPTNTTTFTGQTSFEGWIYDVDVKYVSLMPNSSDQVNHQYTVAVNGRGAMDGLVAILTVKAHTVPANATSNAPSLCYPVGLSSLASAVTIFLGVLPVLLLALP